jgi:hypothetical protein
MMKFPISFTETNGGFQVLYPSQDEYFKQILAVTARTEPGTHPLTPDFGVQDPTFKTIDRGQFLFHAGRYVPEIEIQSIETSIDEGNGENTVTVHFSRRGT